MEIADDDMWGAVSTENDPELCARIEFVIHHNHKGRRKEFLASILDQASRRKLSDKQIESFVAIEVEVKQRMESLVAPAWSDDHWSDEAGCCDKGAIEW